MVSWLRMFAGPLALFISLVVAAQEMHVHPAPEKLGEVTFPISCKPSVQEEFNRGVALLHSFAYSAAEQAFQNVADRDSQCAMAYWGIAMTHFHQLWEPPIAASAASSAQRAIEQAGRLPAGTERERLFIAAATPVFRDAGTVPYPARALGYEKAMSGLAARNKGDVEAQVFYALALLANASPSDKTHARQKQAAAILEPLFRTHPQHPGIPHYLIHAYDNAELAPQGLAAARAYAKIAPSAPHALHMPSHIFTRLGLWNDSIASNLAAQKAAHQAADTGEELHAMDYLVYAYLQSGRNADAAEVLQQLRAMPKLNAGDFKVGYAATAMPIRYAVERRQWNEAADVVPPAAASPHVTAIAVWARGIGMARGGHVEDTPTAIESLQHLQEQLQAAGNEYWATQVGIMKREVMAWSSQAQNKREDALVLLREAADEEDSVEKLPVTPGPIVPAREQLGDMLLEQGNPKQALTEFQKALANAPGRRGALQGVAQCAESAAHPAMVSR